MQDHVSNTKATVFIRMSLKLQVPPGIHLGIESEQRYREILTEIKKMSSVSKSQPNQESAPSGTQCDPTEPDVVVSAALLSFMMGTEFMAQTATDQLLFP